MIKSPLVYWGSKKRILSQMFEIFPKPIKKFYDVFGGSGTVSWNVRADEVYYNEINSDVIRIIKWLYETDIEKIKKDIFELMNKWGLTNTKYETENYYLKKSDFKMYNQLQEEKEKYKKFLEYSLKYEKENPLYIYIYIWYSLSAFYQWQRKEDNILGKTIIIIKIEAWKKWVENKKIHFYNLDFLEFLKQFNFNENDDFIYLDPPYLKTDCKSYNGSYDVDQQQKLFDFLDNLTNKKIKWAMSNVNNGNDETLIKWIADHNYIENKLDLIYTQGKAIAKDFKERENNNEILITNYQDKKISFKWEQLSFF